MDQKELEQLSERMEELKCTAPPLDRKVFRYAFKGEPDDEKSLIERHLAECEKCRVMIQAWREKARVGRILCIDV